MSIDIAATNVPGLGAASPVAYNIRKLRSSHPPIQTLPAAKVATKRKSEPVGDLTPRGGDASKTAAVSVHGLEAPARLPKPASSASASAAASLTADAVRAAIFTTDKLNTPELQQKCLEFFRETTNHPNCVKQMAEQGVNMSELTTLTPTELAVFNTCIEVFIRAAPWMYAYGMAGKTGRPTVVLSLQAFKWCWEKFGLKAALEKVTRTKLTPETAKLHLSRFTRRCSDAAKKVRQVNDFIAVCFFAVLRQELMDSLVDGQGCGAQARALVAQGVLDSHHFKRIEALLLNTNVLEAVKVIPERELTQCSLVAVLHDEKYGIPTPFEVPMSEFRGMDTVPQLALNAVAPSPMRGHYHKVYERIAVYYRKLGERDLAAEVEGLLSLLEGRPDEWLRDQFRSCSPNSVVNGQLLSIHMRIGGTVVSLTPEIDKEIAQNDAIRKKSSSSPPSVLVVADGKLGPISSNNDDEDEDEDEDDSGAGGGGGGGGGGGPTTTADKMEWALKLLSHMGFTGTLSSKEIQALASKEALNFKRVVARGDTLADTVHDFDVHVDGERMANKFDNGRRTSHGAAVLIFENRGFVDDLGAQAKVAGVELIGCTVKNGKLSQLTRPIFTRPGGGYVLGLSPSEHYLPLLSQEKLIAILAQVTIDGVKDLPQSLASDIPLLQSPRDPGFWLSSKGFDSTWRPILVPLLSNPFNGSAKSIHLNSGHKFGVNCKCLSFQLDANNSIYGISPKRSGLDVADFRLTPELQCDEKGIPTGGDTSGEKGVGEGDIPMEEAEG